MGVLIWRDGSSTDNGFCWSVGQTANANSDQLLSRRVSIRAVAHPHPSRYPPDIEANTPPFTNHHVAMHIDPVERRGLKLALQSSICRHGNRGPGTTCRTGKFS